MREEAHKIQKWIKSKLKKPDKLSEREVYLLKKYHPSWYRYVIQYRILNKAVEEPEEYFEQVSALERHKRRCPYCQKLIEVDRDDGQADTAVAAHVFNKEDPKHGGKGAYPNDWNKKKSETTQEEQETRQAGDLLDQ